MPPKGSEVSAQLLAGFTVIPAQFYPDRTRVICRSFAAKGAAVAGRLLFLHPAKRLIGVPDEAFCREVRVGQFRGEGESVQRCGMTTFSQLIHTPSGDCREMLPVLVLESLFQGIGNIAAEAFMG